jgi:selenide,water dikinase
MTIRLTQYSHGAGCGCKLSPAVLDTILADKQSTPASVRNLLVGNSSRDDAGAVDIGDGRALLSTTDFFMPIVDDPFDFGRIASANAISDIYAMGGTPVMAIAILGWPVDKLPAEVAGQVIDGARHVCNEAGIALAGGHSIDSPEPIFGLAVNGLVPIDRLKHNDAAQPGDKLFLTKSIGVGILSTAEKKGLLRDEDVGVAAESMMRLNTIGAQLAEIPGVSAITDVTGFGLLGHLGEMCVGSGVNARIEVGQVRMLADLDHYLEQGAIPGGTGRNWESYGHRVGELSERDRQILCDPQTSGGLLVAVSPDVATGVEHCLKAAGLGAWSQPIGEVVARDGDGPYIEVVRSDS